MSIIVASDFFMPVRHMARPAPQLDRRCPSCGERHGFQCNRACCAAHDDRRCGQCHTEVFHDRIPLPMSWAKSPHWDDVAAVQNRQKKYSQSRTAWVASPITRRDLKCPVIRELVKSPERFTTMEYRERGKKGKTKWGHDRKRSCT